MAIRIDCPHCGGTLQVKDEYAGRKGKCPKCQKPIEVPGLAAAVGVAGAARPAMASSRSPANAAGPPPVIKESGEAILAASAEHLFAKVPSNREELREQVLGAFRGQMKPPAVSLFRRLGGLVVLLIVLVLPLFYLVAVGGLIAGLVWVVMNGGAMLSTPLYWLALIGGGVILYCLLKPLIEPRRRVVELYPLSPDQERLLADFVARVCESIDAVPPGRIQLECSVRCLAESRRGVTLTLGLPLIASLSVEQLGGLVAGLMAQHRRRAGCKTANLVRSINGWLWRSIYEDGRFDAWLARVASRPRFHMAKLLVPLRGAKLVAQAVLFIPMFIGNTIAANLVRAAELDADRCAARLIGREGFAALLVRLGVIDFTWQGVLAELNFLHKEQQLPDSLPQQLALRMLDMTPELCAALRETVNKSEEKPFDSRPSDDERLAAIREEPVAGALASNLPASALLANYDEEGRKMTWDYYVATFGPKLLTTALVRV